MSGLDARTAYALGPGLDAYQATLEEEAAEARERSYVTAARPDAVPYLTTFADLRPGDFMREPEGPRWVEVVEIVGPSCYRKTRQRRVENGELAVMFEIPEPVHVSGETRYWIRRPSTEPVTVDLKLRA